MSQKNEEIVPIPPGLEAAMWQLALNTAASWNLGDPRVANDAAFHNIWVDIGRRAWPVLKALRQNPQGIRVGPELVPLSLEDGRLVLKI